MSEDQCQYDHPMSYCKICGTWMHCRPDGELHYRRRPNDDDAKMPPPVGERSTDDGKL